MEIDSSNTNKNNTDRLFCFVDGCFTTSARNKNLGFHQFPPNDEKRILRKYKNGTQKFVNTRQLWIEALNIHREGTTVIGKMRVCSLHFSRNDYNIKDVRKPFSNLKLTAIPRRNLPLRRNSKLTTRLHVRGFNRIKFRGRLSFQDLDVRVPTSRNRRIKKQEQTSNQKEGQTEEEKEDVEECMQVEGFSLASLEDGIDKTNELEGESGPAKDHITSEFIIKEEPISDNEQEIDDWNEENIIAEVERSDKNNQSNDWHPKPNTVGDQAITTESVLEDLESSGGEEEKEEGSKKERKKRAVEEEKEEEEKENEEEEDKENEEEGESNLRDRPCKSCGKRDCRGHNGQTRPAAFVCVVCNELFHTPAQLDAHSAKHDEEMNLNGNSWHDDFVYRNSKDLECKICGKHLATKTVLKEHVSRHVGDKLHVCLLCGRQFRHKVNLVVHVNAHTIVRTFKCPQCPMSFGMRVDLEDHLSMHAELDHKCEECGAGFASQRALWTHRQVHNRKKPTSYKKKKGSAHMSGGGGGGGLKKGFPCRVCSKVLSTKNTLREHMMIHSGEKPHECMLCGKLIRHKANFILHVQSHSMRKHQTQVHYCDVCEESFATKTELRKHHNEAHSTKHPHKCILCGETFRKEEGLMEHVEEAHGDKKDVVEVEYQLFQPHLLDGLSR